MSEPSFRTNRETGNVYVSGRTPPKRCPKCGKVAASIELELYKQCFYCYIDTSEDETAKHIRSKGLYMQGKKGEEILKRRALRQQRGT